MNIESLYEVIHAATTSVELTFSTAPEQACGVYCGCSSSSAYGVRAMPWDRHYCRTQMWDERW